MKHRHTTFFFSVDAPSHLENELRVFFLENSMKEAKHQQEAELVVSKRFDSANYALNQYWVVTQEGEHDNEHEGLFYLAPQIQSEYFAASFKQLLRSFRLWNNYSSMRDQLVVPKNYLEIFSKQIQVQLKGMSGLSNILKESYLSDLQREKYADYISGNANRLQNFFANLWEYYQYRHRQRSLKIQTVQLRDFITEIHERFERILASQEKEAVDFRLTIERGIRNSVKVETDKRRLLLIISNLLENAIHFTQAGTIHWNVSLTDDYVVFGVENTITNATNSEQNDKQLGIGLLVGHYNAEIIHGTLTVEHNKEHTRAILELPLCSESYAK